MQNAATCVGTDLGKACDDRVVDECGKALVLQERKGTLAGTEEVLVVDSDLNRWGV